MSDDQWLAMILGGGLILIAAVAWLFSKRWPLASAAFMLTGAAMGARLAIKGPGMELAALGAGEIAVRLVAGAAALWCLYAAVTQVVIWWRYRDARIDKS
jgi:hypothetical protein